MEELKETEHSKMLASAMVDSSREKSDDTLLRAVNLLQNQNGDYIYILLNMIFSHVVSQFKKKLPTY